MTGAVHRLVKHLARMKAGDISDSTMHRFMGLLRELLEERGDKKRCPTTTMFCDWLVHPTLDRSLAGGKLLDILDDAWSNSSHVDAQICQMTEGFSPWRLRDEIVLILGGAFVDPSFFLDDPAYLKFMGYLTADLAGKPIARRPGDIERRTAERLANGYRHMADRLLFQQNEQGENEIVFVARQIEPVIGGEVRIVIPWPIPPVKA